MRRTGFDAASKVAASSTAILPLSCPGLDAVANVAKAHSGLRLLFVGAFGNPALKIGTAETPSPPQLEGRNFSLLRQSIDRPLPCFEVSRDLFKREDFAFSASHLQTILVGFS